MSLNFKHDVHFRSQWLLAMYFFHLLRVRSFGVIRIGSWCIKEADESVTRLDSSVLKKTEDMPVEFLKT